MIWYKKITRFLSSNWWYLSYIILLIITFAFFIFFQSVPTFADPDSFYHTKMALLIPEEGVIKSFPWLQFTVLRDSYIDQHFLYHVFLVPFTQIMDPIQGAKLANIFLSVGLVILFYWLLQRYKIKFAYLFTLLLLVTTPFIFRINLIKAPVFSILILLLGLYLIFQYRYLGLFFVSFFYVWAYGGFVLILVFTGIYAVVGLIKDWFFSRRKCISNFIIGHNRELRLFLVSLSGVLAGLVINPYFPQNIIFYWHQLVKIGIVNYQKIIPVGNEWYPYSFIDLTAGSALLTIILLISLVFLFINYKRLSKKTVTLLFIFIFFLLFTLKSRRYVEYYVPFAIIFSAFSLNETLQRIKWRHLWTKFLHFYTKQRVLVTLLIIYFLIAIPSVIIKDIRQTHNDFKGGISLDRFSRASAWLMQNSQEGEIVFHSSWDEFPVLFYFNSKNYYIAGLDPTFSYEYDKELYHKMVDITTGKQRENVYEDIKNNFKASYVFVEKNHDSMNLQIQKSDGFKEVYQDEEATIYEVL